jgi:hypothetical protein
MLREIVSGDHNSFSYYRLLWQLRKIGNTNKRGYTCSTLDKISDSTHHPLERSSASCQREIMVGLVIKAIGKRTKNEKPNTTEYTDFNVETLAGKPRAPTRRTSLLPPFFITMRSSKRWSQTLLTLTKN